MDASRFQMQQLKAYVQQWMAYDGYDDDDGYDLHNLIPDVPTCLLFTFMH